MANGDRYFTPRGKVLKRWVRVHLWVYRRTNGRLLYKMRGMSTLLLTTTGRKSGRPHTVPLPFVRDGEAKVVIGSFAGNARDPAWALNVRAEPAVEVQVREDVYRARAQVMEGESRQAVWSALIARYPWYADYQTQTEREIPLVRLERSD